MKKNFYLLSLLFLCSIFYSSTAHAQYWCWAMDSSIMTEAGASQSAIADLYGNVYTFGAGKRILKHKTADGSVVWMRTGTGSAGWNGTKLTVDNPGNIYAVYDSASQASRLMKIDSFSNTVWVTNIVGMGSGLRTYTINPDNIGNLYISGQMPLTGVACGLDTAYSAAPNRNSFVARYDTMGNAKWVKPVLSSNYVWASSVAGDLWGNVFIGGICKGDTLKILDSTVILGFGPNVQAVFVAKCDSDGHLLWVTASRHTNGGGYGTANAYHIRVDDAGNAYFAGMFFETDTLGTIPIVFAGGDNVFMAKYRGSDGAVLWAKTGGNTTMLYSMSCSRLGKPYLIFRTSAFTTHFSTTTFTLTGPSAASASSVWGFDSSGNVICGFMLGGMSAEDDVGVVTDLQGNAYIHGDYMNTVNFGEISKTSTTGERYFLAKYTCNCLCGSGLVLAGGSTMCTGNTITMTSSGSGGTWSSTNPSVATVTTGGVITAVAPGTSIINYVTGGGCSGSAVVTVMDGPTITGGAVCAGTSISLAVTPPGGTFTSSSTGVATVGPTGVVTGVAGGTTLISYETGAACIATAVVTVSTIIPSTTGGINICAGASTAPLTSTSPGGTWSSSNTSVATIGLTTGIASGVAPGTAVISYVSPGGCTELTNVTVNAVPGPIGGKFVLCETFSTLLNCTPAGGTWSIGSPNATVNTTGLVTGVTAGTATVTYMIAGGCFSTAIMSVNPLPGPITGPITVAVGSSITLTNPTPGGAWTSGDTTKGKVNSIGKVTGIGLGTVTIYYTLPTGCKQSVIINVVKSVAVASVSKVARPSLYPNPASNEITVKADQAAFTAFTIYNLVGQVVATHEITSPEIKINVKAYPPGEYHVVFKGGAGKEVLRFTKL